MSKLTKAIEKARLSRQNALARGVRGSSGGAAEARATGTDGIVAAGSVATDHHPILDQYLRAASVKPDDWELSERRVIAGLQDDDRVEPYRQLRTQVLKILRDNGWNTLAITSAHESAGKSLTAANLAISLSRDVNNSVLLVDLDLRTPTVHEKFGMDPENGLLDYLNGDCKLEDILINPGYDRLVLLPSKRLGRFASEVLSSPPMKQLMQDICTRHDPSRIVIFDLPSLMRNDDALLFTPMADATLLVVEDGVTTEQQLTHSLALLEGANLIGTVLNKARDIQR